VMSPGRLSAMHLTSRSADGLDRRDIVCLQSHKTHGVHVHLELPKWLTQLCACGACREGRCDMLVTMLAGIMTCSMLIQGLVVAHIKCMLGCD
jgi:hypothetical protein